MHFEGMASKYCTFDAVLTSLRSHGIILLRGLVSRCTHMIRSHTYTRAPSVSADMHRSHIDISTHYFTIRTSRALAQLRFSFIRCLRFFIERRY